MSDIIQQIGTQSKIDIVSLAKSLSQADFEGRISLNNDAIKEKELSISSLSMLKAQVSEVRNSVRALGDASESVGWVLNSSHNNIIAKSNDNRINQEISSKIELTQKALRQISHSSSAVANGDYVGSGSFTIDFGQWDNGTFAQGDSKGSLTGELEGNDITLDSVASAINALGSDIVATVVYSGNESRLSLKGANGEVNGFRINVEDGEEAGNISLSNVLSVSSDNTSQMAQDSLVVLDGIEVRSDSHTLENVVAGISIDISAAEDGDVSYITTEKDTSGMQSVLKNLVKSYNELMTVINDMTYRGDENSSVEYSGALASEGIVSALRRDMRVLTTTELKGTGGNNSVTLSEIGIQTERNGSLSFDNDVFDNFIKDRYDEAASVFQTGTYSPNVSLSIISARNVPPGEYDIDVLEQASKGYMQTAYAPEWPWSSGSENIEFQMNVDGVQSAVMQIPENITYDSAADFIDMLQTVISQDSVFSNRGISVDVRELEDGKISVTSNNYGSISRVEFMNVNEDLDSYFGLSGDTDIISENGSDIIAEINGTSVTGRGRRLSGATGTDSYGLSVRFKEEVSQATVYSTKGIVSRIDDLLSGFLDNTLLNDRATSLQYDLSSLKERRDDLASSMEIQRKRYLADFTRMESAIAELKSTEELIKQQVDAWSNN